MIEHVELTLQAGDPPIEASLHGANRTLTPPISINQLRAALEQGFVVKSLTVKGNTAEALVLYPQPEEEESVE